MKVAVGRSSAEAASLVVGAVRVVGFAGGKAKTANMTSTIRTRSDRKARVRVFCLITSWRQFNFVEDTAVLVRKVEAAAVRGQHELVHDMIALRYGYFGADVGAQIDLIDAVRRSGKHVRLESGAARHFVGDGAIEGAGVGARALIRPGI